MVTAALALLFGLAIWGSTLAFRNSYTVMLPLILGSLASLLLALVGVRGAWFAGSAGDGTRAFWLAGTCAALAPFGLVIGSWLW